MKSYNFVSENLPYLIYNSLSYNYLDMREDPDSEEYSIRASETLVRAVLDYGPGVNIPAEKEKDIICHMEDGWRYLIDNVQTPASAEFLTKLNNLIAGCNISDNQFNKIIEDIGIMAKNTENSEEIAIKTFIYFLKEKPLRLYNFSMGLLLANKILIDNNEVLYIRHQNEWRFQEALELIEQKGLDSLMYSFLYDCITYAQYENDTDNFNKSDKPKRTLTSILNSIRW